MNLEWQSDDAAHACAGRWSSVAVSWVHPRHRRPRRQEAERLRTPHIVVDTQNCAQNPATQQFRHFRPPARAMTGFLLKPCPPDGFFRDFYPPAFQQPQGLRTQDFVGFSTTRHQRSHGERLGDDSASPGAVQPPANRCAPPMAGKPAATQTVRPIHHLRERDRTHNI